MNLTDEQLIRACAELDGWRYEEITFCNARMIWVCKRQYELENKETKTTATTTSRLPDYLNSRDAIIGVIEKQGELTKRYFEKELAMVLLDSGKLATSQINWVCATPRQLATALVRATGKDKQ